ncbi:unnamed protein product [Prunus brigantina]
MDDGAVVCCRERRKEKGERMRPFLGRDLWQELDLGFSSWWSSSSLISPLS